MAQIYRVGKDIFDASTNQKIANPNVLATQYKGATEIQAPNLNVPTGATKILNPAGLQGLNESQLYRQGADIYKLPSAISSDMITGGTAPTIKPVDVPESSASLFMAGIGAGQNYKDLAQKQEEEKLAQTQTKSELEKRYEDLSMGASERKLQEKQQVYNESGINTLQQEILNKRSELTKLGEQFKQANQAQEGRKGLAGSIYGRQALVQKDYALKYGAAAADLATLQQNYTEAKKLADETLDLKYEDIETEIQLKKDQLDRVYKELDSADQKRADQLKLVLEKEAEDVKLKKEEEKNISDLSIKVAEMTGDSNLVKQIQNAGSYTNAINLATPYLKTVNGLKDLGNGQFQDESTGQIGTINEIKQTQNLAQGIITSPSGISYDWSTYNRPGGTEYIKSVQNSINNVGKLNNTQELENYLKTNMPNSNITAQDVIDASNESGVGWEEILGLIQKEAPGGASGVALKNNNFGGITWSSTYQASHPNVSKGSARPAKEGGNYVKFNTVKDGLIAQAEQFAKRKTTSVATTPTTPDTPVNSIAVNWAENIRDGKAKLSDITSEVEKSNPGLKSEVNSILKSLPPSERQINEAQDFVKKLKELKDNSGLKYAVGPNWATRGMVGIGGAFGAKDDFLGKAQTLISKKALGALIEAKSQGATFGALSDAELALLKSSGTTLSAWANEKNEKVTGFDISEKKFKEELDNMITEYEKIIAQANGGQSTSVMSEDDAYKLYQQTVNKK